MKVGLEERLTAFLDRQEESDAWLRDHLLKHDAEDKERHAELKGDFRILSVRIGIVERDVEKLEGREEKTGSIEVAGLRDETKWWRRGLIAIVFSFIGALVTRIIQQGRLK